MKTILTSKTAVVALAITAVLVLSSFLTQQQNTKNKYLTLRVVEVQSVSSLVSQSWESRMVIAYEDGRSEEILLEKLKPQNLTLNTKAINDAVNSIARQGYELVSVSSANNYISTYTFVKK